MIALDVMGGGRATACWMAESSRASCKVARGHTRERNGRGEGMACWMAESSRASCKVARGHTRERNGRGAGNGLLDGRELEGELQGCAWAHARAEWEGCGQRLAGWPRAQGRAARLRVGTRASGMGGVRATACWMAESSKASCKVARGHTRRGNGAGNGLLNFLNGLFNFFIDCN